MGTRTEISYKGEGRNYTNVTIEIRLDKTLSKEDYTTVKNIIVKLKDIAGRKLIPKEVKK